MLFDCSVFLDHVHSLFYRLLFFSPSKKRLMSPENSTRKVNTILKCQEINDIVLSSWGPVGEGDKCLALFTPFLPICDLFLLCLSFWLSSLSLSLLFSISLLLSLPCSPPPTLVSRTYPHYCVNDAAIFGDKAGDGLHSARCAVVSKRKHWCIFIITQ